MAELSLEKVVSLCKRRGFVFPSCELYGGFAGFFDYGPLGVELKNNIRELWWKEFVRSREDVVGIDGCTLTKAKVFEASGHVEGFFDPIVECKRCKETFRADHLLEDHLNRSLAGIGIEELKTLYSQHKPRCPECGGELGEIKVFNLMFKTYVGALAEETHAAYLRPETAQHIFMNFKLVMQSMRLRPPFGIAQIGRGYRNEISPRNFLFRMREFEMMEIEYFVPPYMEDSCPYLDGELLTLGLNVLSIGQQQANRNAMPMKLRECIAKGYLKPWHAYWVALMYKWFLDLGVDPSKLRIRQHLPTERSHYARDTWDIEYLFPFGWKEITGIADRGTYDLTQHMKFSGIDLSYYDEEKKEKLIPFVIEPSQGVDRAFLVFLMDAWHEEEGRVILRLDPRLAPYKVAVFPLVNRDGLPEKAREIFRKLKNEVSCYYDESGSIGRRYARQDEIGTPFCVTIDYQTLEDDTVTIRNRDTKDQVRVGVEELAHIVTKLCEKQMSFDVLKKSP